METKELRQFGLLLSGCIILFFGALFPLLKHYHEPAWPWIAAGMLVVAALLAPRALNPLYRAWLLLGNILKFINTRIILSVIYFGIFMPISFFRRCLNKDSMHRQYDQDARSYREAVDITHRNMEHPF